MIKIKRSLGILLLLAPIFKDTIGQNFSLIIVIIGVGIIISTQKKEDKEANKKELKYVIPILLLFVGVAMWVYFMT